MTGVVFSRGTPPSPWQAAQTFAFSSTASVAKALELMRQRATGRMTLRLMAFVTAGIGRLFLSIRRGLGIGHAPSSSLILGAFDAPTDQSTVNAIMLLPRVK